MNEISKKKYKENIRKKRQRIKQEKLEKLRIRIKIESKLDNNKIPKEFEQLPISEYTLLGLKSNSFFKLRKIQQAVIPYALNGRDILGTAKTGSGKTLSFIIPVLERLYHKQWGDTDGLGALILAPTRELATQIFEVLNLVGKKHNFYIGLFIGGKKFEDESIRIRKINIMVVTPGRLLQHFHETYGFFTNNLMILILDEADRCLDMGFQKQIEDILENLPKNRQTMLFSATLSKNVTKLAKLSLNEPQYIKIIENNLRPTPQKLLETYMKIKAHDKINFIWKFIRSRLSQKIMIFCTTRKQCRYLYEIFRRLQPGIPLKHIHGGMCQPKRLATYYDAKDRQGGMVLFATPIVSRGLDFYDINWVICFDCPSDIQSYIHTVGRTARNLMLGNSLLLLLPSEKKFLNNLEKIHINPQKLLCKAKTLKSIVGSLQSFVAENINLKYLGEKAFISYVRSLFLEKDKEVFQPQSINFISFAKSLGLPGIPQIEGNFVRTQNNLKNLPYKIKEYLGLIKNVKRSESYVEKMLIKKNVGIYSKHYYRLRAESDIEDNTFFKSMDGTSKKKDQNKFITRKFYSKSIKEKSTYIEKFQKLICKVDIKDKLHEQKRIHDSHKMFHWKRSYKKLIKEKKEKASSLGKIDELSCVDLENDLHLNNIKIKKKYILKKALKLLNFFLEK